jgi:hypothetical protein
MSRNQPPKDNTKLISPKKNNNSALGRLCKNEIKPNNNKKMLIEVKKGQILGEGTNHL